MPGDGSSDLPSAASGAPRAAAASGTAFDRFRQLHQIGTGSLGPVFRGEDLATHEPVALKHFQLSIGPERTRLIADELQALAARLPEHPQLPRLLAAGLSGDTLMTVSAFAAGEGLDAALRAFGPAAIADAADRLLAIASALDRAAAAGIWHGALHPADIIVSATDTAVTGVGVAQALEKAHVTPSSRAPYAAPEVTTSHRLSPRADQFALAAMAHEWLFGAPIDGPADQPLTLPRLPGVDHERLIGAFTTALAPDPADRFATNVAFVEAVQAAANRDDAAVLPPGPVQGDLLDASAVIAAPHAMDLDELPLEFPREAASAPVSTVVEKRPARPAPEIDLEPEKPVFWRGELAAATAEPSSSRTSSLSGIALVAVFAAGLALGAAGGYLMAGRRAVSPPSTTSAPRADATAADAERPAASASLSAERAFTDTAVPMNASPAAAAPPAPAVEPAVPPAPPAREPAVTPASRETATPAAAGARLLVRSSPAGATVTVDGVARGTTPLVLRDLPIGARNVVVSRRGYMPAERRITLSGDRPSRSIDVTLAPAARAAVPARPAPASDGSLVIESRPAGASVSLDGRPVCVTPLTIASVAPGRHTVVITAAGMKPVTSTVVVKAGERARVAASLERGQQEE